ncbi:S-adenosylmethionine:tRNA ribosyltransferase-isomerase [Alkalihalophilus pseudofirmus]|uniref:S-adenosylmethionine:tRNA ribosyltransferase-isomerase n=1 Tax=Alkalihalophilus pseudofirmus TaxID=79885 RepID=UPI000A96894C
MMINSTIHSFKLPSHLHATTPAEVTRNQRSDVRLLTLHGDSGAWDHHTFEDIIDLLQPNDLLILNTSRTIPSSLRTVDGAEIRLSRKIDEQVWEVLILEKRLNESTTLYFDDGISASIVGPGMAPELTLIEFSIGGEGLMHFFYNHGQPITYEYIDTPWQLSHYQTVYSHQPGSVEMNSAGRAFSHKMLKQLKDKGVQIAYVCLHTGLSYYENNRWPDPLRHFEWFSVGADTVEHIYKTKKGGHRVVAVGTTVVRALESAHDPKAGLQPQEGLTNVYIEKDTTLKVVDGLITGFHEPEASHLDMLCAFVQEKKLIEAYQAAINEQYLWHEFGDLNLIWKRTYA